MAQLFKRTKKSCIKFFRKFTSSAKSSAARLEESSGSLHKSFVQDEASTQHDIPMRCPYTISSKITCNRNKNKTNSQNRNYGSSMSETKKSTNFVVSSHYANKFDTYLSSARQTIRPSLLSCNDRGVRSFRLLSEEDAANVRDDISLRRYSGEIVFEKVKYRDKIRYFRRTPSNASLCSHPSTPKAGGKDFSSEKKFEYASAYNTQNRQSNIYLQFRNNISCPVNVTLTSNAAGNLNNLVVSEGRNWMNEPCPVVSWDINGNSMDDEIICLNGNWDDCDNRLNMLRDKRLTKTRSDYSHKSSSKSSSTTLETWVDDEILDNSFNEEIENHFRM